MSWLEDRVVEVSQVMRPMTMTERSPAVRLFLFLIMVQGIRLKSLVTAPDVVVSIAPPGVEGTTCR